MKDQNRNGLAVLVALLVIVALLVAVWSWMGAPLATRAPELADAEDRNHTQPPTNADGGDPAATGGEGTASAQGQEQALAMPEDETPTDEELSALQAELEADPQTHVVCDLGIAVDQAEAYLAIGGHSDFNGRRVQIVNSKAYMPLVYDLGDLGDATFDERSGLMSLDGYGPVEISWSDRPEGGGHGRCVATIEPEEGSASLTGTLTLQGTGEPATGAWVEGCGNMAFVDDSGIVHMDIVAKPCTLIAMRQDGLLRSMTDPIAVVPVAGQDVVLDIELPVNKRGGLGVRLGVNDDGQLVIEDLMDVGPAGAAGLQPGDVIVEIDGEAIGEDALASVKQLGGQVGTEVALTVDRDSERLSIVVVREALEAG